MGAIKLTAFGGEQPKIIPRLLPPTGAQAAVNARLDDGGLTPVRKPALVTTLAGTDQLTIYKHGDEWLSWPTVVHAAPGPVADDRLYFTGDGVPKLRVAGVEYPLAVERPTTTLTAAVDGAGSGDVVTRTYVFTWVTAFGEESEPSPATAPIDWQPGDTLTLSGFPATPAGRNITLQRIYRSQTGQSGTYLYLIAERAASSADYIDDVAVDAFQEALPSADWNAPPDTLEGLIALPNGMMAAFVGKALYFCEPFRPHAWPEKYVLTTDWPIVGLGAVGTSIIVATEGHPYLVAGSSPSTMQMVKLESNMPCINARGIVDLGFAICYPSVEGLVAATADGTVRLVSTDLFGRYEWQALSPASVVAGQYGGRYMAFYDTTDADGQPVAGSLFIDVGDDPFLVRSSERAQATFYDVKGSALYYVPQGSSAIYRFDAPSGARAQLYWRSKQFIVPAPTNYGAIRVDSSNAMTPEEAANLETAIADAIEENTDLLAAGTVQGEMNSFAINEVALGGDTLVPIPGGYGVVQVGVIADGVRVASVGITNKPTRLPAGFTAERWEIDVTTSAQVTQIVMGHTMDDLRAVS